MTREPVSNRFLATLGLLLLLVLPGCRTAKVALESAETSTPLVDLLPMQWLLRLEAEAPGERATLRLTLRLWEMERFELVAADLVGRTVWRLEVDGEAGTLEVGGSRRCRLSSGVALTLPGLELPLAAADMPAVLLGRVPFAAGVTAVEPFVDGVTQRVDPSGRHWSFDREGGELVRWSVRDAEGEHVSWQRERSRMRLEASRGPLAMVWREGVRAPLTRAPRPHGQDADLPDCHVVDLS